MKCFLLINNYTPNGFAQQVKSYFVFWGKVVIVCNQ